MKRAMTWVAASLLMLSCSTKESSHKCINTLPAGISIEELTDCTVPAKFTTDDFNWMGGNLTMTVYNEDLYDAVDIQQMQVGDTLMYENNPLVVTTLEESDGIITINGGVEEDGAWLQSNGGGTYRATVFDDHSIYTELGEAQVPLADDFVFIDCGENPTDPSDTVSTNQKLYIESLQGYKREFFNLNTSVLIEHGVITKIERRWIP